MSWTTPKTDWESTDFFNQSDYNRIKGNIEYISELGQKMYPFTTSPMGSVDDTTVYLVSLFNTIEDNLYTINRASYRFRFEKKTWVANRLAPSFDDFNRWETLIDQLCATFEAQYNALPRLPFRLGNAKGVRT